jgi:hypothetical protein
MLCKRAALVVLVILSAVPQLAEATCVGTTLQFSPDPPGPPSIDRTLAIQTAIDQAAAGHPSYPNRTVVIPVGRWLVTGALTLKKGVTLCGATNGPFERTGDPADTTAGPPWAATLLITHTTAPPDRPFIHVPSGPNGGSINASVTDLLFHYPCQRRPDCSAPAPPTSPWCSPLPNECVPKVYPDTIRIDVPARVERCTVTNAYSFLDIQAGRVTARDLYIGAFMRSINVDNALDRVTLSQLSIGPWWDYSPYDHPAPIDQWVRNNGYAFVIQRADSMVIDDVLVLNRYSAFYFTDSGNGAAYGVGTHVSIDGCKYCIQAQSTNGFVFSDLFIYGGSSSDPIFGPAVWGVWPLEDGSPAGPTVAVHGGVIAGDFSQGIFDVSNPIWPPGKLVVSHVIGYDE